MGMLYQNAENVQFYRRDSRSVVKAQPRLEKRLNPKISYSEVKCHWINGGKKHISKATGAREGMYEGCPNKSWTLLITHDCASGIL